MANPQKENGSTDIANELLEAIYSCNFNGTEFAIILCILRYTYGFHRKSHSLSIGFISKAINRNKINVSNYIKKLIENNVLIEEKKSTYNTSRMIGINKDYSKWKYLQLVNILTVSKYTNTGVSKYTNRGVSKYTNQETKNKTKKETKNIYGEFRRIKLTKKEYEKLCEDFGKEVIDLQIKKLDEYVESNNNKNKYTNFNLVLRKSIRDNWFKKQGNNIPEWLNKNIKTEEISKDEENELQTMIEKYK